MDFVDSMTSNILRNEPKKTRYCE